jgi:cell wall assembly regulator SMI1
VIKLNMIERWNEIEQKLKQIAPAIFSSLNAGVSDSEVQVLEKTTGTILPADFINFYKIHNGQSRESAGLMYGEELLSVERMLEEWTIWKDLLDSNTFENNFSSPDSGVKNNWWNPLWIPITYDGSGNHYCLDLDPSEQGHYGQIIRMWHDDDVRSLVATSFDDWVYEYTNKLLSGQLVYSEDYFGIVDREDV